MKVVDVFWFCAGHGNVGIVKCLNESAEIKYYVGSCTGMDEDIDMRHIANLGSRFPDAAGKLLFGDQ